LDVPLYRKRDFWYTRWQHCWLECDAAIW